MAPKEISMAVVKEHNKAEDLWIVIENKVYDLTKFRREHPGGEEPLDEVAGKEATKEFNEVGHSSEAREMMKKYYIGDLDKKDRNMKLPVREIGIAFGAVIIGIATVFVIRGVLSKN